MSISSGSASGLHRLLLYWCCFCSCALGRNEHLALRWWSAVNTQSHTSRTNKTIGPSIAQKGLLLRVIHHKYNTLRHNVYDAKLRWSKQPENTLRGAQRMKCWIASRCLASPKLTKGFVMLALGTLCARRELPNKALLFQHEIFQKCYERNLVADVFWYFTRRRRRRFQPKNFYQKAASDALSPAFFFFDNET